MSSRLQNSVQSIHRMIEDAAKAHGGTEAMQRSQAALNSANALAAIARLPPDPTQPMTRSPTIAGPESHGGDTPPPPPPPPGIRWE